MSEAEIRTLAEVAALKAHPAFVAHGWSYWDADTPTVTELRQTVERLVRSVVEDEVRASASGRFTVRQDTYELGKQITVALDLGKYEENYGVLP